MKRANASVAQPAPKLDSTRSESVLRSSKILDSHLQRLAIVYIRQSTPHQVLHHRESSARQYALVNHVVGLGWPRERVVVIDEDQGQSGKSAEHRTGFHRLLAEVSMQHVGLIMGLEMSRLARSSRDWHHLLEMCALFGTILGDEDGIYNPSDSNDRLLLGLKGTISEFELVTMRNRLDRGRLNKAQRAALFHRASVGYHKLSSDRIELEPDEQARGIVQLIFDKFDELGSARAVLLYLLRNHLQIGYRPHAGPHAGQLQWFRPTFGVVRRVLTHPVYAGAYAYGRRCQRRTPSAASSAQPVEDARACRQPHEVWAILLRDRLPAYISWDRYLANQERLHANRPSMTSSGVPREGEALLAGLVRCAQCGRRLRTRYLDQRAPHYFGAREPFEPSERTTHVCRGLRAKPLDELLTEQVLLALQPAALELSWQAVADLERERARLDRQWQQQLQRAAYEVRDAERRYRAVDPDHRLVARTLEQNWDAALRRQRELADDYDRFLQTKPASFTPAQRAQIERLAADIPALWHAETTTAKERKEIIRHLVAKVVVQLDPNSEQVVVTIGWHGGFTSQHVIVRPISRMSQLSNGQRLLDRLVELRRAGCQAKQIAERLHAEGFRPPKRCNEFFDPANIRKMLYRLGVTEATLCLEPLEKHEWRLAELAEKLGIAGAKLRAWAQRGWLHARQTPVYGHWILWADHDELRRLRQLKRDSAPGVNAHAGALTQPKKRPSRTAKKPPKEADNSTSTRDDVP
jgi:DNA invertase Pin-like site-specific DNA recombinase